MHSHVPSGKVPLAHHFRFPPSPSNQLVGPSSFWLYDVQFRADTARQCVTLLRYKTRPEWCQHGSRPRWHLGRARSSWVPPPESHSSPSVPPLGFISSYGTHRPMILSCKAAPSRTPSCPSTRTGPLPFVHKFRFLPSCNLFPLSATIWSASLQRFSRCGRGG